MVNSSCLSPQENNELGLQDQYKKTGQSQAMSQVWMKKQGKFSIDRESQDSTWSVLCSAWMHGADTFVHLYFRWVGCAGPGRPDWASWIRGSFALDRQIVGSSLPEEKVNEQNILL